MSPLPSRRPPIKRMSRASRTNAPSSPTSPLLRAIEVAPQKAGDLLGLVDLLRPRQTEDFRALVRSLKEHQRRML